jgi:hypothetical protein
VVVVGSGVRLLALQFSRDAIVEDFSAAKIRVIYYILEQTESYSKLI